MPPRLILCLSFPSSLCRFLLVLLKSQAGPMEVQMAGVTARRASPRMTRCSPSQASEATPAQPPQNLPPLLQCLLPMDPPRKWIFLDLMGRGSAAHVLPLSLCLLEPQPLISWGTCLGGRHSQPVGHHLPSPHRIKWSQTLPHHLPLLHHQVR